MRALALLVLSSLAGCATMPQASTAPASVKSTRVSAYDWTCKTSSGSIVKGAASQDDVFEACANAALAHSGLTYTLEGAQFTMVGKITGSAPAVNAFPPQVEPQYPLSTPVPFATTASIKTTLVGEYEWACRSPSGSLLKGSASSDAAYEVCANAALGNPGLAFTLQGPRYTVVGTITEAPAEREAIVSWIPPTENDDGGTNPEFLPLTGYQIAYGQAADAMDHLIEIPDPAIVQYKVSGLPQGTTYFTVAARNQYALSVPSEVVTKLFLY